MSHRAAPLVLMVATLLASAPAAAQGVPSPPGPYVIDVHGVSSRPPGNGSVLSTRCGRHILSVERTGIRRWCARLRRPPRWSEPWLRRERDACSREGDSATRRINQHIHRACRTPWCLGGAADPRLADVVQLRHREGWSYLGAGIGLTEVSARTLDLVEAQRDSGLLMTINAGAGARWFLTRRIAVGFDARVYRVAAAETMPASMLFAISAGVSLR